MAFIKKQNVAATYESPGALYRDLPRRPGAVPGLWAHQSEMLKSFVEHSSKPDVALELPTGTGKTLTGLLIAEWTRRFKRSRVIYACPTQQLAKQVAESAYTEGIEASLLIGSHHSWPMKSHGAYEAAEAIAITTYSSIFNSNPHFEQPELLLFDDAHAGEQYVSEKYSIRLERRKFPDEYDDILKVVGPALDSVFLERLSESTPGVSIQNDVRLVIPLRQDGMVNGLTRALGNLPSPLNYQYSMLRDGLSTSLVYVSYNEILIRHFIPPTHQNRLFGNAGQRVYLSATLGEGGELERAFGRLEITRLAQLDGSTAPRYGRRYFVFPELLEDGDPLTLATEAVKLAGKALILAPQSSLAMETAKDVAQDDWPVLGIADVEDGLGSFADLKNGVCGLAARYDGLDLPGEACRAVVLRGTPDQDNLQERFLLSRARANVALASRIRTRFVQGAGRCTRGPEDTAVIVVMGPDLTRYLSRPEVVDALDAELQAEIRFGKENSEENPIEGVLENVSDFLSQATNDNWRANAEPIISDYRRESEQRLPVGTRELASSVADEVHAWACAVAGDWSGAAARAADVARKVGSGGTSTEGYRAFWLYLQAVWLDEAASVESDDAKRGQAASLVEQAIRIQGLGSWVRQMAVFPQASSNGIDPVDAHAIDAIVGKLQQKLNPTKIRRTIGEMQNGLQQQNPSAFEPALSLLGGLLGAESHKPDGQGRCDSTWCWANLLWLAVEAKSAHLPQGSLPLKDIRQANDQLRLLRSDRRVGSIPTGSATVIISPKPGVAREGAASAESTVFLATIETIQQIADDLAASWEGILSNVPGRTVQEQRRVVEQQLRGRGVLPTTVLQRLTTDSVSGKSIA